MIFFFIFFVDVLLFILAPTSMDKSYMVTVLGIAFYTLVIYLRDCNRTGFKLKHVRLRHSVFFLICFFIVFFQCDLDYVLGIVDNNDVYLWINEKAVSKSLAISNLALISFIIGYRKYNGQEVFKPSVLIISNSAKKTLSLITLGLIVLYIVIVPRDYLSNGYQRGIDAGGASVIMGYLQACFISLFTIYSMSYSEDKYQSWSSYFKKPLVLAVLYSILILVTGRRTEVIRVASVLLIAYLYCRYETVRYKKLLIYGFIGILLFSIQGALRAIESGSVMESVNLINQYQSISPFTREYAGSVNTLHIAVENYPSKFDYNYGQTFFPSFFKIIPGLYYFYETYIIQDYVPTSGEIFTDIYFSGDKIWGLGSSILADIYISFGVIGICLILMIFGYFVKYLEISTFVKRSSPYVIALSFSTYSAFLFACRSSMSAIFLCWTYSCILIFIFTRKSISK